MKEIPLKDTTQVALVDDYHHAWLMQHTWCLQKCRANRTSYAYRIGWTTDGRKARLMMHREILGLDVGDPREADHRDGNGLNNQESNLRIVSPLQNAANRPLQLRSRTGYKGVCPDRHGLFRAVIRVHGIQTRLGLYSDVLEASFCYNTAAAHLYGEHARLNPIPPDHIPPERQAQLRQEVLTVLAEQSEKPLTTRSPGQVSWDASRSRWRVKAVITDHWVYIGSYHDKAEADYAAALALDPNAVPDPTIKPTRLEFIKKRVAYLHSIHQPEPEPAGI